MIVTFRPLPTWPHPPTPAHERRSRWTFKASYRDTLALLDHEVYQLDGHDVVVGIGLREQDIRLDGMPRANAPQPFHPGVELSFDSRHGRLTYSTDVCEIWQHNLRSIALGLEALRAADRYGITRRGEQYAGFAAIPATTTSRSRGRELVERYGSVRAALMETHPDRGGDTSDFQAVQAYREEAGA